MLGLIKYNIRKWDIRRDCGEYVVRKRRQGKIQKKIVFVARSTWALRLGLQNCERARTWGGSVPGKR